VDSVQDAIEFIHATGEKPLAAYLFTNNKTTIQHFGDTVSSGSLCVNDTIMQAIVEGFPFGGVGQSGMGSYHGKFSFDTFSHKKPILAKDQRLESMNDIRYPPYKKDWAVWHYAKKVLIPSMTPKRKFSFVLFAMVLLVAALAFRYVQNLDDATKLFMVDPVPGSEPSLEAQPNLPAKVEF